MSDKFVIPNAKRLAEKLSLKNKPYGCKTLARSVEAGTITAAQARKHNPAYDKFVATRKEAGVPVDSPFWVVQEARKTDAGKTSPAPSKAKAKRNGKSEPAPAKLTAAQIKRMTKAELIALVTV